SDSIMHASLGLGLQQADRLPEAIGSFRRALALAPRLASHHHDLGMVLYQCGEFEAALDSIRRAIALDPQPSEFRANLGMVLLHTGEFREGWAGYQHRGDRRRLRAGRLPVDAPYWTGEPLADKRILIFSEQGLGDTLQFARYLHLLLRQGATVTCEV